MVQMGMLIRDTMDYRPTLKITQSVSCIIHDGDGSPDDDSVALYAHYKISRKPTRDDVPAKHRQGLRKQGKRGTNVVWFRVGVCLTEMPNVLHRHISPLTCLGGMSAVLASLKWRPFKSSANDFAR